jgi:hypothetical protein
VSWSKTSPHHPRQYPAGDILSSIVASTEAKSAAQVNDLIAKLDKGASVTLQLKRGEQQFFSALRVTTGE